MTSYNVMKGSLESASWQDYRASNIGMVVFYASDPISEIPIREIPEELPSEIAPEPNYETGTYKIWQAEHSILFAIFNFLIFLKLVK